MSASTQSIADPGSDTHAGARLTINLGAVVRNYRLLEKTAPRARVSAVIKADAYGTGALPISKALADAGCDLFFVSHLDEALELRGDGAAPLGNAEIAVLNGLLPGQEPAFAAHRLVPVLNTLDEIDRWSHFCVSRNEPLPAYIHADTGMNRLGLSPEEVAVLAADPGRLKSFPVPYILSHLACADTPGHPLNREQLSRFRALLGHFPDAKASLANSGGIFLGQDYQFDMVRPGIALYGGNPFSDAANPCEAVVNLTARILQIRQIDKPASVGYGATYAAPGPKRIATVSIGYADGFFRSLASGFAGIVAGHRAPLAGRVSMDLVTLDVTNVPEGKARVGDWVTLLGDGISVDDAAAAAGTIGYEILTALGQRYARIYSED